MMRYIDRLTPDARTRFEADCTARGIADAEQSLIELASVLTKVKPVTVISVIADMFGEAAAPEAVDVIEQIQSDLDRQAMELEHDEQPENGH